MRHVWYSDRISRPPPWPPPNPPPPRKPPPPPPPPPRGPPPPPGAPAPPPPPGRPPGRPPPKPRCGGCGPIGSMRLKAQRKSSRFERWKLSGRESIAISRPCASRTKRLGKAFSISMVGVGKPAIGLRMRLLV